MHCTKSLLLHAINGQLADSVMNLKESAFSFWNHDSQEPVATDGGRLLENMEMSIWLPSSLIGTHKKSLEKYVLGHYQADLL